MRSVATAVFAAGFVADCSAKAGEPAVNGPELQGTFKSAVGPNSDIDGRPAGDLSIDSWVFRSTCNQKRCIATAVAVPQKGKDVPNPPSRVFDFIGGKWISAGVVDSTCRFAKTNEAAPARYWKRWALDVTPDGAITGTIDTWAEAERCNSIVKGPIKLAKVAEDAHAEAPDPTTQAPLAVSPAAGLHGRYSRTGTNTDAGAPVAPKTVTIATECLRTGDRCVSVMVFDKEAGRQSEDFGFSVYAFSGGVWTRKYVVTDQQCDPSGMATLTRTEAFRLPDAARNPITRFEEDAEYFYTGDCPGTQHFKYTYERIGD